MTRKRIPLPEEFICQKYVEGINTVELGKEYGCSSGTIINILNRNNIQLRNKIECSSLLFDKTIELEICQKYLSKYGSSTLAKEYNCNTSTILNILNRNNISIRKKGQVCRKITEDDERTICELYVNNITVVDICKKYICHSRIVLSILKKNNIQKRTISESNRKYSLDESYFNIINLLDKAYWLGWMYSDGCNLSSNNNFTLHLSIEDKHIVELFSKYLKTNMSIKLIPQTIAKKNGSILLKKDGTPILTKPSVNLSLGSKRMSEDLTRLGCVSKKSLILKFPTEEQVPEQFLPDFIRGYFEGDGCIYFNNKNNFKIEINIVGTKEFLEVLRDYLLKNGLKSIGIKKRDYKLNKNTYILKITNILDLLKFKKLIYDDYLKNYPNGDLILHRKYNKFLEIKEHINKYPKYIKQLKNIEFINLPENIYNIINMYVKEKISRKKIAEFFNVDTNTVKKILINNNISIRNLKEKC